jgi:hypothetical protein
MFTKHTNINRRFLALGVAVALLATGCSKQLEITPEVFVSPEQLYKDEAGAEAGVTGIYRQLLVLKSSDYAMIGIIGTDEGKTTTFVPTWGTYWQNFAAVNSYSILLTAQNDMVQGFWNVSYKGIGNANVAIKYIQRASINQSAKDKLVGEAKFLRAVFYFNLVQLYGGIPMPTEADNAVADRDGYPRSTADQVYELIVSDLKFAAEHLNAKADNGTNKGRANKEAAAALLGKVYLTRKDYANAKTVLEPLLNTAGVNLLDSYADLFKEANENNNESLFEIQFSNENGNTSNMANYLGAWQINDPTLPGAGGHTIIPTDRYINIFENGDKRKDVSLRSTFYDKSGNLVDWWWWADTWKPHVKKYDITAGVSVSGSLSSRNLYYLRLADVILMYAEVQNELSQTGVALTNLNKIRKRAGLNNWEVVLGAQPTKDQMKDELLKERMRELGFEGWRWFDLKRTDKLLTETKANNPDAAANMTNKNLLYPLPTKEFENNPALKPGDQNPGY